MTAPAKDGERRRRRTARRVLPAPVVDTMSSTVRPFARTGRYFARSWRDYRDDHTDELPIARPTLSLAAQAFRDEVVLAGLLMRRPISEPQVFQRINDEVVAALDFYGSQGWLEDPEAFFAPPPPLSEVKIRYVNGLRRTYQRLTFESGYRPHPDEPGAERWLGYTAMCTAHALMLRHPEPRPWLICVHGTEMGRAAIDLRIFRAWKLHEELGLNVVLPVLPMHGPRARDLPKGAVFPGEDILDDVHATAQAVWDIRRLLSWIRAQEPDSAIGLNGMSLGGYIAALVASLESGLTCAILGVPAANLVDLLGRHSGLRRGDPRRETVALAEPIGRMLSPLSLRPQVPMRGRFVYAGIADQVVHPREQVSRLWEHWGRPRIIWYRGGHAGFIRSRPVQRFIRDSLVQSGLVTSG
ncbi:alpha/beta hydrolase family protein [Mycobacterium asiaticum]|uniref:alpha/beta hydrolase family protein n=1 Tax=Mycobacterium asiaticum TaxID=1790 RepID=UPI0005633311|nr:alpha/beta hydrolase [Mycobacterium asiaticum DSM 44297]